MTVESKAPTELGEVRIEPLNIIIFSCNEYQIVGNVKIMVNSSYGASFNNKYTFSLQTSNKSAYSVSKSVGEIPSSTAPYYITIFINNGVSLEQCLKDRFKLTVKGDFGGSLERVFKVFIEYTNHSSKIKKDSLNGDNGSKTGSATATSKVASSIYTSVAVKSKISKVKRSMLDYQKMTKEEETVGS